MQLSNHIGRVTHSRIGRAAMVTAGFLVLVTETNAVQRFVNAANPLPSPPYTSWEQASITIQGAVDVSNEGDEILVANGTYATGGLALNGLTNRVAATKPVTIRSVNGPTFTTIQGYQIPGTTNGAAAVRPVYLTNGATLSGFTLTNGATLEGPSTIWSTICGGGVYCEGGNVVVSNCVIDSNASYSMGGGAFGGTVVHCTLTYNKAPSGGGAASNNLINCSLAYNRSRSGGGGVFGCRVDGCTLMANSSTYYGAGAASSTLENCTILGNYGAYGGGAYFCSLTNCMLRGNSGDRGGGGYACDMSNCTISNCSATAFGGAAYQGSLIDCVIRSNSAPTGGGTYQSLLKNCVVVSNTPARGGGASGGELNNCVVSGNSNTGGYPGGGVESASLNHCTVTGNSALCGAGGASDCRMTNCIVYYNESPYAANYDTFSSLSYCCTTPLPLDGRGNLEAEPRLASDSRLAPGSPCIGKGTSFPPSGVDIDHEPWSAPPSIGCDEYVAGTTGALVVAMSSLYPTTNVATEFAMKFRALISGPVSDSRWEFGDGTTISNRPYVTHTWTNPGDFQVVLRAYNGTYASGVIATTKVHVVAQPVHFVATNSTTPVAPYSSWTTAATNIQNAIDTATTTGALILVGDGLYQTGGRLVGGLSNRVVVTRPLIVRSSNGAETTVIKGNPVMGSSAVRCVYLANGAQLAGFTISNGGTLSSGANTSGGGLWCESGTCQISDCIIISNAAAAYGGGVFGGALSNCAIAFNSANNGSVYAARLRDCAITNNHCLLGGGASYCSLDYCLVKGNTVDMYGGGAYTSELNYCRVQGNRATSSSYSTLGGGTLDGMVNNCLLVSNVAYYGGGIMGSVLRNCTVTRNSAYQGGGCSGGPIYNSIVYYNTATNKFPNSDGNSKGLTNCCTTPMPTNGMNNITDAPRFVDPATDDFRLQADSPCINSGNNIYAFLNTDFDRNPRIAGRTVDIGAYEFQAPTSVLSYAWAQQYGYPVDGSQDFSDGDRDGFSNWEEWVAGTNPGDGGSALRILSVNQQTSGLTVTWLSVTNREYFLERRGTVNGDSIFQPVASGIPGQQTVTSFIDTNVSSVGSQFYRVGVVR